MLPVKILPFPEEDKSILIPALDGPCYEYAVALTSNTQWPLVGLILDGTIRHAGVRRPDGLIHDARGAIDDDTFASASVGQDQSFEIRPITETELVATRPIDRGLVRHFCAAIPCTWPELPLPDNHPLKRMAAFAEALRRISMEHGICIREAYPTAPVHLAIVEGDERYVLTPTIDGRSYVLTREIVPCSA